MSIREALLIHIARRQRRGNSSAKVVAALGAAALLGSAAWVTWHSSRAALRNRQPVRAVLTLQADATSILQAVRKPQTWSQLVEHIQSVTDLGNQRWIWRAEIAHQTLEWETTLTERDQHLEWRTPNNAPIKLALALWLETLPNGRGTAVFVELLDSNAAAAPLLGKAQQAFLRLILSRLRAVVETGETPTTIGQPVGRGQTQSRALEPQVPRAALPDYEARLKASRASSETVPGGDA